MQTPKKGSKKTYAPNQRLHKSEVVNGKTRSQIVSTNNKGKVDFKASSSAAGSKIYNAKQNGVVVSDNQNKTKRNYASMDTTGYAAGKKEFTVDRITKKAGELGTKTSVKIKRDQVMPTISKWKSSASKMKKGGTKGKKK